MNFRTPIAATLLALATATAFAQTPAAAGAASTPRVDARQAIQDKRIDQGVNSGQLTPRETRRLEREQRHVARAEANAKADGTVSAAERKRLHRMQNGASKDIARQKHDGQAAAPAPAATK
jgi:hypothetical protein